MLTALSKQLMPPWMQSMARRAKLEHSLKTFERRVATHRFGEVELKVSLCDPVGEEWYDHDSGNLAEITFFKESGALKDGAVVFDLGAHQAVVALQLATHVGPAGRVVALEANAHNARVASENVALNGARNLTILHAAAASRDGTLEFNESLNGQVDGGAGTHGKVQVTCRSIDSLVAEFGTPDIVYVDVEGFECAVLDGAGATRDRIPNWFVEVHGGAGLEKFGGSVDRLLGYFPADRFKRHFCRSDEGPFVPLSETGSLEGTRWFFIATRI